MFSHCRSLDSCVGVHLFIFQPPDHKKFLGGCERACLPAVYYKERERELTLEGSFIDFLFIVAALMGSRDILQWPVLFQRGATWQMLGTFQFR